MPSVTKTEKTLHANKPTAMAFSQTDFPLPSLNRPNSFLLDFRSAIISRTDTRLTSCMFPGQ